MEHSLYSDNITFNEVDAKANLRSKKKVRAWLMDAAKKESKLTGELSFNFCSDDHLLKINREYLNHDYYTDIITFDLTQKNTISGDIYISIERVKDNAKTMNIPYQQELLRVMIHGVMHLCGYKDKTKKQSLQMREKEDHYLSLL